MHCIPSLPSMYPMFPEGHTHTNLTVNWYFILGLLMQLYLPFASQPRRTDSSFSRPWILSELELGGPHGNPGYTPGGNGPTLYFSYFLGGVSGARERYRGITPGETRNLMTRPSQLRNKTNRRLLHFTRKRCPSSTSVQYSLLCYH